MAGYIKPQTVKSPKGAVTHLRVIHDGGPFGDGDDPWSGWSAAEFEWHEEPALGLRWNGTDDSPLGHPQVRGIPMWFVVPGPLENTIREAVANAPELHPSGD